MSVRDNHKSFVCPVQWTILYFAVAIKLLYQNGYIFKADQHVSFTSNLVYLLFSFTLEHFIFYLMLFDTRL